MIKEDVLIGGEESGGISILGHIPEGDGILMGLLLVELVASTGKTLGTLVDELMAAPDVGPFHYARLDQEVPPFDKATLVKQLKENAPATLAGQTVAEINDSDGVKFILADNSWLLIRPSGTEPVLRIYAEARNEADVQTLLQSHQRDVLAIQPILDSILFIFGLLERFGGRATQLEFKEKDLPFQFNNSVNPTLARFHLGRGPQPQLRISKNCSRSLFRRERMRYRR